MMAAVFLRMVRSRSERSARISFHSSKLTSSGNSGGSKPAFRKATVRGTLKARAMAEMVSGVGVSAPLSILLMVALLIPE